MKIILKSLNKEQLKVSENSAAEERLIEEDASYSFYNDVLMLQINFNKNVLRFRLPDQTTVVVDIDERMTQKIFKRSSDLEDLWNAAANGGILPDVVRVAGVVRY